MTTLSLFVCDVCGTEHRDSWEIAKVDTSIKFKPSRGETYTVSTPASRDICRECLDTWGITLPTPESPQWRENLAELASRDTASQLLSIMQDLINEAMERGN